MSRLALAVAAALALAAPVAGAAGSLVPPPGFTARVEGSGKSTRECPAVPPPYTGRLEFPSKFEGSDKARDDLNEKAYSAYKQATAPINDMEKQVSSMVQNYLRSGDTGLLRCAMDWMHAWAKAGALLQETQDHTGRSVRKWALASLASAYVRLKFSESRPLGAEPDKAIAIEKWLSEVADVVVDDWRDQPLEKFNNHEYWAAWAVMAAAVALNRRELFDWAVAQYRIAAKQVDKDGYLPNELKRDTRALAYHNYSLGPLAMIAAFARANGVDVAGEGNGALKRLATRVLAGVDNPAVFEERTGKKQALEDLKDNSKFAWLEPYCWMTPCDAKVAGRMEQLRPMKTYRLGGDVTELFTYAGNKTGCASCAAGVVRTGSRRR